MFPVPSVAAICSSVILCFPGMLHGHILNHFEIGQGAFIMAGICLSIFLSFVIFITMIIVTAIPNENYLFTTRILFPDSRVIIRHPYFCSVILSTP
jgi:hypothetical protein